MVPPTIPERLRYVWANINTHTQTIKYQFISLLDVLLYDKYANNLYRFRYTPLMPGGNKKNQENTKKRGFVCSKTNIQLSSALKDNSVDVLVLPSIIQS